MKQEFAILRRWLSACGYQDLMLNFNPINVAYWREIKIEERLVGDLRLIWLLLAAGKSLDEKAVHVIPTPCRALLTQSGFLVNGPLGWSLNGRALLPICGNWLICDHPALSTQAYFGEDSIGLLMRLSPQRRGRALDLCAGPGVQSLQATSFSSHVITIEQNPSLLPVINFNFHLNEVKDQTSVYIGDLYSALPSEPGNRFDDIIANPPLVPVPDSVVFPIVGHGGPDGLRIIRQILAGLRTYLAERGQAQIIGCTPSDGLLPLCQNELDCWAKNNGYHVVMSITAHYGVGPGQLFFDLLVQTAVAAGEDRWGAMMQFDKCFVQQHASHVCTFHLRVMDDQSPGLFIVDISTPREQPRGVIWFR